MNLRLMPRTMPPANYELNAYVSGVPDQVTLHWTPSGELLARMRGDYSTADVGLGEFQWSSKLDPHANMIAAAEEALSRYWAVSKP